MTRQLHLPTGKTKATQKGAQEPQGRGEGAAQGQGTQDQDDTRWDSWDTRTLLGEGTRQMLGQQCIAAGAPRTACGTDPASLLPQGSFLPFPSLSFLSAHASALLSFSCWQQ